MAAKYGVEESGVPPWNSSLDGICDALDRVRFAAQKLLSFVDRRNERGHPVGNRLLHPCPTRRTSWFRWRTP